MTKMQAHERAIKILVRQIFNRQLKPGDKLPSERQLAKELHIDRASLRIALKHMEMMNVLTIRHGDGIYVRDYLKGASIDFLRILFMQTDQPNSEWLVDPYILDEVWEFWCFFLPEILKLAAKRMTSRDIKTLLDILDEELISLDHREHLVDLELKSQELIAETTNNMVIILITQTCKPLRKKMIEIFFSSIEKDDIKNHIETKKQLIKMYLISTDDILPLVEQYRHILNEHRLKLRKLLLENPEILGQTIKHST